MRRFFGCVMICSLLLAVCGCSEDTSLQKRQDLEFPDEPDFEQEKTGKGKPDSSGKQEQDEPDIEDSQEPDGDQEETDDPEPQDYGPPEFADFNLVSKKEIRFNFTKAVTVVSCAFTPYREIESIQAGKTVIILLKENLELQTEFLIELNVEDNRENSLSVEAPLFVGDWIPKIEINELRTEYSKSASRAEYVEFKVKSAGELNGLRIYIMWDAKKTYIFDLPAIDVKSGEYITLHLRTLESGCIDELGDDLSMSAGTDSCPTARDLWIPDTKKLLHKTDIVYLQDANGDILDAVILNEKPSDTWNRTHFAEIAEDLYNKGMWKSADGQMPTPFDAVDTSTIKSSATKSISRYEGRENTHTASDWYVTGTGGASPGQPNK